MTIEYRAVGGSATATEGVLEGLVTPFNVWTTIGDVKRGGFKERSAPGSFTKTLQERDVVLIDAHDTSKPMARTSVKDGPGWLTLTEVPDAGLRARAVPVDTSYARDVMACADAGVTCGMSYGFEVIKDEWTDDAGNPSDSMRGTHRTIREVRLHEVTTTAFPAYTTTELSVRDAVNAARGVVEARAAKATYSDLHTCGECGSTSQYGSYCGDCGKPMGDGESADEYCTSCGSKMSGKRSEHVCETRESVGDSLTAIAAELLTVYNALPLAFRTAVGALAKRDEVDGDPEGAELLRVQALGALADLLGVPVDQIPPSVSEAVAAIEAYKQSITETVSATGGHGDVSEGARSADHGAGEDHSDTSGIEARRLEARCLAALLGIPLEA